MVDFEVVEVLILEGVEVEDILEGVVEIGHIQVVVVVVVHIILAQIKSTLLELIQQVDI